MEQTKHLPTIAINDAYKIAPHAQYLYACDLKWWKWHDGASGFSGMKITQDKKAWEKYPDLYRVPGESGVGLSLDPSKIHTGQNGGFQAFNLAVLMGASRILLLGYDMRIHKNGSSHWFGDHPDKQRPNYKPWLEHFADSVPQLDGVEVINCSPDSALTCFPMMSVDEWISYDRLSLTSTS